MPPATKPKSRTVIKKPGKSKAKVKPKPESAAEDPNKGGSLSRHELERIRTKLDQKFH